MASIDAIAAQREIDSAPVGGFISGPAAPEPEPYSTGQTSPEGGYPSDQGGLITAQNASDTTFAAGTAPAPVISVDTFADIRAAQMARDVRVRGNAWNSGETGGYAGYAKYRQGNPGINEFLKGARQHSSQGGTGWDAIQGGYTPSKAMPGSVNLAPVGINVGYRSGKRRGVTSFDQLAPSTKAAVKAAGVISQSENETETTLAQIFAAFQRILGQAQKNTANRSMGQELGITVPGDK